MAKFRRYRRSKTMKDLLERLDAIGEARNLDSLAKWAKPDIERMLSRYDVEVIFTGSSLEVSFEDERSFKAGKKIVVDKYPHFDFEFESSNGVYFIMMTPRESPFEYNKRAIKKEAGSKILNAIDVELTKAMKTVAKKIVALDSFRRMASSQDMVKDALIAMSDAGSLPEMDDDMFSMLRDAVSDEMRWP